MPLAEHVPVSMLQVIFAVLGNLAVEVTFTPVIAVGGRTAVVHAPAVAAACVSEATVAPSAISTIQLLVAAFVSIRQAFLEDFLV